MINKDKYGYNSLWGGKNITLIAKGDFCRAIIIQVHLHTEGHGKAGAELWNYLWLGVCVSV